MEVQLWQLLAMVAGALYGVVVTVAAELRQAPEYKLSILWAAGVAIGIGGMCSMPVLVSAGCLLSALGLIALCVPQARQQCTTQKH